MSTDRAFVQPAKLFEGLDAASLEIMLPVAVPRALFRKAIPCSSKRQAVPAACLSALSRPRAGFL